MALSKFKLALADYDRVRKMRPGDKDAAAKFDACQKIVRRMAFERAIASDHTEQSLAESIRLEDFGFSLKLFWFKSEILAVEGDYNGPRLDGDISMEFMKDLIGAFKEQKKLHTSTI